MINKPGRINKNWGYQLIHFSTDEYCLKEMIFLKAGNKFSLHAHKTKKESWLVLRGKFRLVLIDTTNAQKTTKILNIGQKHTNLPMQPHQLIALEDNSCVMEVSTPDFEEDNYRYEPGDSQNA